MINKVLDKIDLNQGWIQVNLKEFNDCYIIAIKEEKDKKDTIDPTSIRKIRFEMGIDCGIKGQPLTIQYFNLDFNDITSGDNALNKISAFTRLLNIPNNFYLKVRSLDDGAKEIKSGVTSIALYINSMNLS